jgi:hypothetical protein
MRRFLLIASALALGGLIFVGGCGSRNDADPVVVPKEGEKDKPELKPIMRSDTEGGTGTTPPK